jgi:hypothetical protein
MTATAVQSHSPTDRWALLRGPRIYLWLMLVSLVVAASTLNFRSTPSYDPWSWLIWGREIIHGQLILKGGSSWKPLPVMFTTVFALFGSAAPDLWLIIARAGFVLFVLMTAKLAGRLTWELTNGSAVRAQAGGAPVGTASLIVRLAPAALATGIALVGSGLAPTIPAPMLLGYSDALATAMFLIAAERAWDGHYRQAFAWGMVPALDRPETWIIWAPYGLWLLWHDRRSWPLVFGLGALTLAAWLVPQKLGGHSVSDFVSHAKHTHVVASALGTSFPFTHELAFVLAPLALQRVELAAGIQILLTLWLVRRSWRTSGSLSSALGQHRVLVGAAGAGLLGFFWWVTVALETQDGFSGNTRYAVIGVAYVYICGGFAYGWGCVGLARALGSQRTSGALRIFRSGKLSGRSAQLGAASATMLVVFAFVPGLFSHRLPTISSIRSALRYQGRLRESYEALIKDAGGAHNVIFCGSMMTNNQEVTMLAWDLDVPINYIQSVPKVQTKVELGPNVIFQATGTPYSYPSPLPTQIQVWEKGGSHYKVITNGAVTMYMDCSPYSLT